MEIFGKLQNTTPVGNSQLSFKQRFKCFSSAIYLKAKFLVTMKYIVLKSKESVLICHHCSNQIHKVL